VSAIARSWTGRIRARVRASFRVRVNVRVCRICVGYFGFDLFWGIREQKEFSVFVGARGLLEQQG
jgi:hypothetical protein